MSIEKEIRIKADGSGLRQLREEGMSLYRDLIGGSQQLSAEQEKALDKLKEQFAVINRKTDLDKLISTLRQQNNTKDTMSSQPDSVPDDVRGFADKASSSFRSLMDDTVKRMEDDLARLRETAKTAEESPAGKRKPKGVPSITEIERPEEPVSDEGEKKRPKNKPSREPDRPTEPTIQYDEHGKVQSIEWELPVPKARKPRNRPEPKDDTSDTIGGESPSQGGGGGGAIPPSGTDMFEFDYSLLRSIDSNVDSILQHMGRTAPALSQQEIRQSVPPTPDIGGLGVTDRPYGVNNGANGFDPHYPGKELRQEEIDRTRTVIDESVEEIDNSRKIEDNSVEERDNSKTKEDNSLRETNDSKTVSNTENVSDNIRNIDRNVENIRETVTNTERVQNRVVTEPPISDGPHPTGQDGVVIPPTDTPIASGDTGNGGSDILGAVRELTTVSISGFDRVAGAVDAEMAVSSNIIKAVNQAAGKIDSIRAALTVLGDRMETSSDKEIAAIRDIEKKGAGNGGDGTSFNVERERLGGDVTKGAFLGTLGAQLATQVLSSFKKVFEVFQKRDIRHYELGMRSQFEAPENVAAQTLRSQAMDKGDAYRWIPLVGEWFARYEDIKGEVAADRLLAGVQRVGEAEKNVLSWAQSTRDSVNETIGRGFREGSYAASGLGLSVDEYMGKRAELLRASGGLIGSSQNGNFAYGAKEGNSLLAAQRLYGLQNVNELQGSMRYASTDDTTVHASSVIIRSFEKAMEDLATPFEQIAAKMDEHIQVFNEVSREVIAKTGNINASAISATQNAVIKMGFQGEEERRVTRAMTGTDIAQDDITQAFLYRAIREQNPELNNLSDIRAKAEGIQNDPQTMARFLQNFSDMSQNPEQMRLILKQALPGLSQDQANRIMDSTGGNFQDFYSVVEEEMKRVKDSEEDMQYDRNAAKRTVGTKETVDAAYRNQLLGTGLTELQQMLSLMNGWDKSGFPTKTMGERTLDAVKETADKFSQGTTATGTRNGLHAEIIAPGALMAQTDWFSSLAATIAEAIVKGFGKVKEPPKSQVNNTVMQETN